MTAANYPAAFARVENVEQGFQASPADPGNWTGGKVGVGKLVGTKYGIAASAHPDVDIANLTLDQARAILKAEYWDTVRGDDMPLGLDFLLFDLSVNSGPGTAIRLLQQALGLADKDCDGRCGTQTMSALNGRVAARSVGELAGELVARRIVYDASLANWKTNALGWARRCVTDAAIARLMAA